MNTDNKEAVVVMPVMDWLVVVDALRAAGRTQPEAPTGLLRIANQLEAQLPRRTEEKS